MDGSMRRVGEPCWHTLGGSFAADSWKPGETVRERVNIYPPRLGYGRFFMAIGLVDGVGGKIGFLPAASSAPDGGYDYVLLVPYDNAPAPAQGPAGGG